MHANAIEAAEQCGILTLPEIAAPLTFDRMLAERDPGRLLVFCDEDAEVKDPVAALSAARGRHRRHDRRSPSWSDRKAASPTDERAALLALPNMVRLALGRASCAPTPPRSPRSRWSERCSEIGDDRPVTGTICVNRIAVWRRNLAPARANVDRA